MWLAYVLLPIRGWGLLSGRPLGGMGALALAAFCWLWWERRSLPLGALAIVALIAKLVAGTTLIVPRGFNGLYYANESFSGSREPATVEGSPPFTRIDDRLSFSPEETGLPMYFFNDSQRFNFYAANEPIRDQLPVSAIWSGWLQVDRPGTHRLYVRTGGARVELAVGGFAATVPATVKYWVGYARLDSGFQPIRVRLSVPAGPAKRLEAGWTVDGREEPFDRRVVFSAPPVRSAVAADRVVNAAAVALDLFLCASAAILLLRIVIRACRRLADTPDARDAVTLAWALVLVDAFLFAVPVLHKMVVLTGGDDPMVYETQARDIALHGIWMPMGSALGHGQPFYFQPLYNYFLAAAHWLLGESLDGVWIVQRLLAGATVVALWRTSALILGERIGYAGLVAAVVVVYEKMAGWSAVALSEMLFGPVVCFWALMLTRIAARGDASPIGAAFTGIVGGLATMTRSTLIVAWPFIAVLIARALRGSRRALRLTGVLVVALVMTTSLATVRNWVVARQLVVVASSGPINLQIGNQPSEPITVPADRQRLYTRLGLDPRVQGVIEYARQRPGPFFDGWRKKAAYAMGSYSTLWPDKGLGRSTFYMTVFGLSALGALLVLSRRVAGSAPRPAVWIPLCLALAHFAALVAIFPFVYYDRMLLPFYALVTPYVGLAAFAGYRFVEARGAASWIEPIGWTLVCALGAWQLAGHASDFDVTIGAVGILVAGLGIRGLPRFSTIEFVAYIAAAAGLCLWTYLRANAGAAETARLDLLCIAIAAGALRPLTGRARSRSWVVLSTAATLVLVAGLHMKDAGPAARVIGAATFAAVMSLIDRAINRS